LHRIRQNEERLAFGGDYEDLGLVFCHEDGTPLRPDWVTQRFGRLTGQLPRIPLHGLRHTHATALLSAGVHPRIVQERLGHSSARVTLDIYSLVLSGMQAEAGVGLVVFRLDTQCDRDTVLSHGPALALTHLVLYTAIVAAIAAAMFQRRDIT